MASKEEKDLEKLRKSYATDLEKAYNGARNVIINAKYFVTNEYNSEISFHLDLVSLFNRNKEYNEELDLLDRRLKKLDDKYRKATERLEKCESFPDDELDEIISGMKNEWRGNLPDGVKYAKMLQWRKNSSDDKEKQYKDQKARINNLLSLFTSRLNEAYKLYRKIQELNKYDYIASAYKRLSSLPDLDEQVRVISECDKYCQDIDNKLNNANKLFLQYTQEIEKNNFTLLNEDIASYFEKKVSSIISSEFLSVLNEIELYDGKIQEYNDNKADFLRRESRYNKSKDMLKLYLLSSIGKRYADLQAIDALNGVNTKRLESISSNTAATELIIINERLLKDIHDGKVKAINTFYQYIIYFYSANDMLDKMPKDVYIAYINFFNDPSKIDECLEIIKKNYYKCYYSVSYDLDTTVSGEYTEIGKQNLIASINRIKESYDKILDVPLSDDILEKYKHINELDIISLYDLYMTLLGNSDYLFNDEQQASFRR